MELDDDGPAKDSRHDTDTGPESPADSDNVDRIVLRRIECGKLDRWVSNLNERFDGMIRITKSDLANFIIRQHPEDLSPDEVSLIESEFYDEVRWLNWALGKIRQAKKEGRALSLDDLMKSKRIGRTVAKVNGTKRKKRTGPVVESVSAQAQGEPPEPNG